MMKLRQCGETWMSHENGHFSYGSNSSWIRNSAISYEKKNISLICIQIPENVASVKIRVGILYIKIQK